MGAVPGSVEGAVKSRSLLLLSQYVCVVLAKDPNGSEMSRESLAIPLSAISLTVVWEYNSLNLPPKSAVVWGMIANDKGIANCNRE